MTEIIKFKKLHPSAILPMRATEGSVGLDLHAHSISETGRESRILIPPNNTRNISTGLLIEPPYGYYLMVCSRSGLAGSSIFVTNAPGVIDSDYRGEIRVLLYNGGIASYYVHHGQRIAQLLLLPVFNILIADVGDAELSKTERGEKGFGSTGL